MTENSEGFLNRWARRKGDAGKRPEPEPPVERLANVPADGMPEDEAPETAKETAEDPTANLPDIETLDKDSDYTGFLREGVPEQLRKQALRKLWRSDPVLANLDGLNDYDEDFGALFTKAVTESVKTIYKVGKGMVDPDDEKAEEIETAATAAADEGPATAAASEADGQSPEV